MSDLSPPSLHRFGSVSVRLSVELGRTEMCLRDVMRLGEGSTVMLDRLTDELLDVTANGRVIARGEVIAEKGRFALRIVTLVGDDGQDVPPAAGPTPFDAPSTPSAREMPGEPAVGMVDGE